MSLLEVGTGTRGQTTKKTYLPSSLPSSPLMLGRVVSVCLWPVYLCVCTYICSCRQSAQLILKRRQASELPVFVQDTEFGGLDPLTWAVCIHFHCVCSTAVCQICRIDLFLFP